MASDYLKKIALVLYIAWIKVKQFFSFNKHPDSILIIKPDAIGDYILFRNFLYEIKTDKKFSNCKITLAGNIIWEDLAYQLDKNIINGIISINYETLNKDWFTIFKKVQKVNYKAVITYNYSRTHVTDIIALVASAKEKIAIDGDCVRISKRLKHLFNLITYDRLIQIPSHVKNEFGYLKYFTECILDKRLQIDKPYLNATGIEAGPLVDADVKYVVCGPGAGVTNRQPDIGFLTGLVTYVLQKYPVYFVGSKSDSLIIEKIKNNLSSYERSNIQDLTGNTRVADLPGILKNAHSVICNDSGLYHMAVAMDKPVLCITGGGHFERFVDYVNQENVKLCYERMSCFNCDWNCIYNFPDNSPYPCISAIDVNKAKDDFRALDDSIYNAV